MPGLAYRDTRQGLHSSGGSSCRRNFGPIKPRPALEVDDSPADRAIFRIDHVLPLETVVAGNANVTPGPTNEGADNAVATAHRFALQLAVDLIPPFVGPDAATLHAGTAIRETDRLGSETDRRPARACEQHRPGQFEDRRAIIRAETQRP